MSLGDSRGPAGRRDLTTSALAVEDDVEMDAGEWDDEEVIKAQHEATGSDEFSVRALCPPAVPSCCLPLSTFRERGNELETL
jgi:hypothetical protein